MTNEEGIQNLIHTWQEATKAENLSEVLALMTDDVTFLTPGQVPMNKASFAAGFKLMLEQATIDSSSDIQELVIAGDFAYCWSYLSVVVTPKKSGATIRRSGYTLTIFRKDRGQWQLARDANMLTLEKGVS
jgi:uncharacterized protein (TIGR02246 family)